MSDHLVRRLWLNAKREWVLTCSCGERIKGTSEGDCGRKWDLHVIAMYQVEEMS